MGEAAAVITGGARGIGREIGPTRAAQGWPLAVCYRIRADAGAPTAAALAERVPSQHTLGVTSASSGSP